MSYIGKQPRKAALTSSDIEDGIITAAKIEDGAVVAAEIASNAVTTAKINADAVTAAKIADDVINSEHIAADSIDAEHYAAGSVDTTALGADAVTGAKIADDAVNSEHYTDGSIDTAHIADDQITAAKINNDIISGTTALDERPADADEFLLSDGGTLKRLNYEFIKPASHFFRAYQSSQQTLSNNTVTTLSLNAENVDNKNGFASNTYTIQAGGAGQWIFYGQWVNETDTSTGYMNIRTRYTPSGGSVETTAYGTARLAGAYAATAQLFETINVSVGDTISFAAWQNSGSNLNMYNSTIGTYVMGIKLN
jgi:hypothetical protein